MEHLPVVQVPRYTAGSLRKSIFICVLLAWTEAFRQDPGTPMRTTSRELIVREKFAHAREGRKRGNRELHRFDRARSCEISAISRVSISSIVRKGGLFSFDRMYPLIIG